MTDTSKKLTSEGPNYQNQNIGSLVGIIGSLTTEHRNLTEKANDKLGYLKAAQKMFDQRCTELRAELNTGLWEGKEKPHD